MPQLKISHAANETQQSQINNYFLKRKIEHSQRGERRQVINDRVHQQEGLSLLSSVKS